MSFIGDYPEDFATVSVYFTTHDSNGAPVAPLTSFEAADVSIYKNGSATQKTSTNGVTMTSPFDSIVGLHCVVIDTSNDTGDSGFWTSGGGGVYTVILNPDTETVNSQVALKVLGTFGICLAPALRPTTAGRTLDVSAGGEAGVDWANVGSPTTALALTGTTIATTQKVDIETIKTQAVTCAGGVTVPAATLASTTNITAGTIGTVTTVTNQLTAAAIATGVWQDATAGDFTAANSVGKSVMNGVALGTGLTVNAVTGLTASNLDATISSRMATYTQPTGFLAATFPGTVASTTNITAGTITTVTTVTNQLTAAQIATGVWQDATAGDFTTSGSIGKSLFTSGVLPGAAGGLFIAGTNATTTITTALTTTFTGNLTGNVGGNVTGSIGSLATQAKADVNAEADTALADYDAPTHTELTAELATADDATLAAIAALNNLSQGNVRSAVGLATANLDTQLSAIASYIDTEVGTLQTTATAIKNKTDSLTFTVAAKLDVNILYVNGVAVTGAGTAGNPWGAA